MQKCESDNDDADLIAAIAKHKHAAFNEFVSRYLQLIYKFVKRYIPQHAQAEDITQDVFMRVWKQANTWKKKPEGNVRSWLYKIAYNRCMDELRQKKDFDHNVDVLIGDSNPEQLIIDRDNARYITIAVEKLPERQRTALYLCAYQGLTNIEAARILAISVDALESLLARARRQLRNDTQLGKIQKEVLHG